MMYESILNFAKQFEFEPVIENVERYRRFSDATVGADRRHRKFIVCGMGGSHLAGDFLASADLRGHQRTYADIIIHSDYGLPNLLDLKDRLVMVSSYSGNTEEEINNLNQALKKKLSVVVISSGGRLIQLAKKYHIPFVQLPGGVQPRMAIGYSLLGMLKCMGEDPLLTKVQIEGMKLEPARFERPGKVLARKLAGLVPVIYSSAHNKALANYWKITFNETGKIPAFYNVFPELNHNEMQGFELPTPALRPPLRRRGSVGSIFSFIFLEDANDHPRIKVRMKVMRWLFLKKGLPVEIVKFNGKTVFQKMFNSILLAAWTAYYLALHDGIDPELVPLIEEFKKKI